MTSNDDYLDTFTYYSDPFIDYNYPTFLTGSLRLDQLDGGQPVYGYKEQAVVYIPEIIENSTLLAYENDLLMVHLKGEFIYPEFLSVTYNLDGGNESLPCVKEDCEDCGEDCEDCGFTETEVKCKVDLAVAERGMYYFTATVNGVSSVPSDDRLIYYNPPEVLSVSGCDDYSVKHDRGDFTGTFNCPVQGLGVNITVSGHNLYPAMVSSTVFFLDYIYIFICISIIL